MTARSLAYLLLLILLYLTINYSGNEFLMVFFFFLCLLPILSLVAAVVARHFLQLRLEVAEGQVDRGADLKLYVHVYNPTFLPLPLISLALSHQDRSSVHDLRMLRMRLGARERERFVIIYNFSHRGTYHIKIEQGRLRDSCGFFILFLAKSVMKQSIDLEVWPRQVALVAGTASNVAELEEEISRSSRISQELDEIARLRAYQPGDKLKLVHWSVSARMQVLQVREFEEPRDLETAIILADDLPDGPFGRLLADAGSEIALGLIIQTVAQKMPTRLILAGSAGLSETRSILIHELPEITLAASQLAGQLPEQLVRQLEAEDEDRYVRGPVTKPDLEDLLMEKIPDTSKIVYLVVYALDERLLAILRLLMRKLAKLYLIVLTVGGNIDLQAYHEALTTLNIQIIQMDAKQFILNDKSESEINDERA